MGFAPDQILHTTNVANVTALVTLNKSDLSDHAGQIPGRLLDDVDRGLRLVLDL